MFGASLKDGCRNSNVKDLCDLTEDVVTRIEKGMTRWFGHLERINESRLTKQLHRVVYRQRYCELTPLGLRVATGGVTTVISHHLLSAVVIHSVACLLQTQ
ncbi:hypothetical protein EVAR_48802_1 [Eumeta japonica]|uniref:Uncharacterized protein n=1 Tax=Eumeta variegata TaxID=151549 RepID=A0A4C1Y4Y2_EUMVA|nr:hypothetical protein EVAR_48802_1 [Eumeta japonica]